MKHRIFPIIILLTGIVVSFSAGYYSITGLSKLFAGAAMEVIIMAASLEFAKLVLATSLKVYWDILDKTFKYYSLIAVTILVIITSIGIYGFLSSAYQITSTKNSISNNEIAILESKKNRFADMKSELVDEKKSLTTDMSTLRDGMNNAKDQSVDKKTGQIISKTNSNIKLYQSELESSSTRKNTIGLKIEMMNDSISKIDNEILLKKQNNTTEAELGPLIFLKNLLGYSMDSIVNVLILMLMVVFDPLAISMLVIAISLFQKKDSNIPTERVDVKTDLMHIDTDLVIGNKHKDLDFSLSPITGPEPDDHLSIIMPEDIVLGTKTDILEDEELNISDISTENSTSENIVSTTIDTPNDIIENGDDSDIVSKLDEMQHDNIVNARTFFEEFNKPVTTPPASVDFNDEVHEFYDGKLPLIDNSVVSDNDKILSDKQKKNMSQWQIKNHHIKK